MANENMIKFLRGNVANLPQTATAGALYFTKDEGIYMGMEDGSYHRYGDFIIVSDVNSLPTTGAHATCMYYCTSENILARYDAVKGWVQINKQPTAEEMKTLLGLGSMAYKSEVAEGDLNADLVAKINASTAANHTHSNKDVIDGITAEKVTAWDAAEQNAKDYADGLAENYAAAEHIHEIADVTGLQDALDGMQAKGDYSVEGHKHVKADITDFAHTHTASEITDFATEVAKVKVTNAGAADTAAKVDNALTVKIGGTDVVFDGSSAQTANIDAELDKKADKSVVEAMYTNTQIDNFIQGVKDYADTNDADTKYGITYDSENKKIKLVEGGTEAEIDATEFIKDGMIETVALSEDGLNLVITWNTDADKGENNVTTIPLSGLVDIYTGVAGDRITVSVSNDDKISADLVAGSISKSYLDDGVQASLGKADTALQEHQDISHLATKTELQSVDGKFANYTTTNDLNAALALKADKTQVATDIADAVKVETDRATGVENGLAGRIKDLEDNKAGYATTGEVATAKQEAITAAATDAASKYETIGTAQGIVDGLKLSETYEPIGAESRAIAEAARLDGVLKTELQAEIDSDVKVVSDALTEYKTSNDAEVAKKANSADVYTKEETYTRAEVEALLTWGAFEG